MVDIRDLGDVSRWRMQIATIFNPLAGIIFISRGNMYRCVNIIKDPLIIFYLAVYMLIVNISCQINTIFDANYENGKKQFLKKSLKKLGEKKLFMILACEFIICFLLILYISIYSLVVALLCIVGLLIGIIYSVPPIRLKKNIFLNQFPMLFGFFFLPVIGGYLLVEKRIELPIVIFSFGYAFINESLNIFNILEDYEIDKENNIFTWAHLFGPSKILMVSAMLFLAGSIMLYIVSYRGSIPFFIVSAVLFSRILYIYYLSKKDSGDFWLWINTTGDYLPYYFLIARLGIYSLFI